ncbi:hypothetical protein MBLNU459_g8396t2 [Dothideomycetes sp. NU459]
MAEEPVVGERRERRVSYGIGGAGNIREILPLPCSLPKQQSYRSLVIDRMSDIKLAQKTAENPAANAEAGGRRRSSVWSMSSSEGSKTEAIKNFFRRNSKDESVVTEN